jgi:hypothetical protein
VVRELSVEKLENCGVVAVRMNFGPLGPGDCGDGPPPLRPAVLAAGVAAGSAGSASSVGPAGDRGEVFAPFLGDGGEAEQLLAYDGGVLVEDGEPKYITDAVYLFGSGPDVKK